MTVRPVVIGDERDGAFNRVSAEHEGSIYPLLIPVLDTYVRTRCPHTEHGAITLADGDTLCDSCSEEVLSNLAKCVGSGDVDFSVEARKTLDDICTELPLAAVAIWRQYGWNEATQEQSEEAVQEIGDLITFVANTVQVGTQLVALGEQAEALV